MSLSYRRADEKHLTNDEMQKQEANGREIWKVTSHDKTFEVTSTFLLLRKKEKKRERGQSYSSGSHYANDANNIIHTIYSNVCCSFFI